MSDFSRSKDGFRFAFRGMKLNARPDALPQGKYPLAINVRQYEEGTLRCRPGLTKLFQGGITDQSFTDLRAYSALQTDTLPRILARTANDSIYLDNGVKVGALAGAGGSLGAVLIPFRPGASPQPWMYIANGNDYQKFSAPAANVVTQQKVGIAEPQAAPAAALSTYAIFPNPPGPGYNAGGTAGATTNSTRIGSDVVGPGFAHPVNGTYIFQTNQNTEVYQRFMYLFDATSGTTGFVKDVFPASPAIVLTILSIFYFNTAGIPGVGTGRCIIVLNTLRGKQPASEASIYDQILMASLRANALIKIGMGAGAETVLVQSVTLGPDGTIAVETSTTGTHTTADPVTLVQCIEVATVPGAPISPGDAIADLRPTKSSNITTGIGTLTTPSGAANPFVQTGTVACADDYISFGFNIAGVQNLTEIKLLFDVDDGTFTKNFYYYTIRVSDLQAAINNAITQLAAAQTVAQRALADEEDAIASGNQGATFSSAQSASGDSQWTQVVFNIGELTRVGNNQSKSLATYTAFQVLFNCSGNIGVNMDAYFSVFGGAWPDVGDAGAPLLYRVRPRSTVTGAVGNPSPATRYGVSPRRQSVVLTLPSAAYDPQINTWDIFRYGGAITSWRFVGATPSTNTQFIDNFSDDAVSAGDALDFDNFEPWPVTDIPNNGIASVVSGTAAVILTNDPDTLNYLPGTLIQLGSQNVYTLRARPVLVFTNKYLLDLVENAGSSTLVPYNIQEPLIANFKLPYMWGPDVNGTVFAVGDSLNPGKLYFAKNYAPDSAPDSFNIEITQPSEPLLGGEVLDGLSFVGSTERWWALYPQPDNPAQRYNFVQQPMTRGLAAPFGHCNDGKVIYWWAKDGIYGSDKGSLTDEDLYNLFPHEGVQGSAVTYNGQTIQAPDYSQAPKFRLSYANGFLYATYPYIGGGGHYAMLVLDIKRMAWSADVYATDILTVYKVEQPEESNLALNPIVLMAGTTDAIHLEGVIYEQTDLINDGTTAPTPITCIVAVNEFDGGDVRAPKQWGDFFLDLIPAAKGGLGGVIATPMSLGAQAVAPTTIPQGVARARLPVSMGGIVVSDFMGLMLQWTEDFSQQTLPTQLFLWQPSFDIQPARTIGWKTFGSSFGLQGFGHIRQIALAWVSTAPITLTITTVDGLDPQVLTIPSSGGLYQKQLFPLTANKGQLFTFQATSTAPFQIFEDDIEIHVGAWARQGPYQIFKSFGGAPNAQSPI